MLVLTYELGYLNNIKNENLWWIHFVYICNAFVSRQFFTAEF